MGSRAGVVVIGADGTVELFYDHWAAQTLAQDAALAGFASTLERVRSMEPLGVSNVQEWASASWMEGALLIDIPNLRVVWAEEGEGLILPRIASHLMEHSWPGWTAIWSPEGVQGIVHLAGADPEPLFARRTVERRNLADNEWFAPSADQMVGEPLSVRLDDGEVVVWRIDAYMDDIACYGPDDIIAFARGARDKGVQGDGWGENWALVRDDGTRAWAERGVHLDAATRTLSWWSIFEESPADHEFDAYWPGWTVRSLGDGYERHEELLGGIPLQEAWPVHVKRARDLFVEMQASGPRANPFFRVAATLADHGHEVTPLPGVLQFVPSTGLAGAPVIFDALDVLAESAALPPARIVDIHGTVQEP